MSISLSAALQHFMGQFWPMVVILLLSLGMQLSPAAALEPPLSDGSQLFEAHCSGCHLQGGNIIRRGKTLKMAALERRGLASEEAIAAIAANGVGQMSGYGSVLGEQGAEAVARWVWAQAQADWPSG